MPPTQAFILFTGESVNTITPNRTIAYHLDEVAKFSAIKQLIDEASVKRALAGRAAATPIAIPEVPKYEHNIFHSWLDFLLCSFVLGVLIAGCLFLFWRARYLGRNERRGDWKGRQRRALFDVIGKWMEEGREIREPGANSEMRYAESSMVEVERDDEGVE